MPNYIDKLNKQKVAIYIRVSTKHQIDKDSLDVQRRELIAYTEMILGISDYYIFEDAGFSAKDTKRPAFQQMIDRIHFGEFSHVLVWKIDRISRNLLDFASMYADLKKCGVAFISKNEQFDTSSAIGEAMLKIILVFAELERNMTAERVTTIMLDRANTGKWNGGHVPYGYIYDKKTKEFSIDKEQALVVKRIFDLYEHEQSLIYVSRALNEKAIKTKRGNPWSPTTVHTILSNVFYIGDYKYNTRKTSSGYGLKDESEWIIYENHHEPIIEDRERFERIQFILKRNHRNSTEPIKLDTPGMSIRKKSVHIFAGLLRCGMCGENMWAALDTIRANGYRPSHYTCKGHRNTAQRCTSKIPSDITLGPFVFTYIANLMRASKKITTETSLDALQAKLLTGKPFASVDHIEPDGLQKTLQMFTAPTDPEAIPYRPAIVLSESPKAKSRLQQLTEQKIKLETAEKRLRKIYLYENSGMTEEEYLAEKTTITENLGSCIAEIEKLKQDNQFLLASEDGFMEKASYFLIIQKLLDPKYTDFEKLIQKVDATIAKGFIASIIKEIVVTDGTVTKITFKNNIVHTFIYK